MRILAAGISELNREKLKTNGKIMLNKSFYGLYGSTVTYLDGKLWSSWLDFVVNNDYCVNRYTEGEITYTLHKNAKIYTIDNEDDYLNLLKDYSFMEYDTKYIDWNKFENDYDAFHLTLNGFWDLRLFRDYLDSINYNFRVGDFYSYESETWIIFNFDCINLGSVRNVSLSYLKEFFVED